MRYLVTGASGFIGRNLVKHLLSIDPELELLLIQGSMSEYNDDRISVKLLDLSDSFEAAFNNEKFEGIIHFAQSSHYRNFPAKAVDIFNVNTSSTFSLANLGLEKGIKKFVYASTGSVYELNNSVLIEDSKVTASNFYAASKLAAEMLLKPYAAFFSVDVLRIFSPYGPDQKAMLIPGLIERIRNGEVIKLNGGKGMEFSPIFITDLVEIISRLINIESRLEYNIYNLGGIEITNLGEVSSFVAELLGKKNNAELIMDAPILKLVADSNKIYSKVNYQPVVNWKEGIKICCNGK